jgi:hypothetical protein
MITSMRTLLSVASFACASVPLGCGQSVVVAAPADPDSSSSVGGRSGSGPARGKCSGEERWEEIPAPFDDFVVGAWTGEELIVFGIGRHEAYRFHSATDTWRKTSAPPPFRTHSMSAAVSSGRFFVWDHLSGAAYDWERDTWSPIAPMGGESAWLGGLSPPYGVVGTPTHLFYLLGPPPPDPRRPPMPPGRMYDVARDTWHALDTAPNARGNLVVWADKELLVWPGGDADRRKVTNQGARFDPATMTWTPMTTVDAPNPGSGLTGVWTGKRLFVWMGPGDDGGLYDPTRDRWTAVSKNGATTKNGHYAAWTGRVILTGSGIYDPDRNIWRPMMQRRNDAAQVHAWDGCRLLAYGMRTLYAYELPPELRR